jgi:hypothetical protein
MADSLAAMRKRPTDLHDCCWCPLNRLLRCLIVLAFALYPTAPFASLPLLGAGGPRIPAGGCAQASTYLARTTSGTEGGNAANVTTLICGLVSDGDVR